MSETAVVVPVRAAEALVDGHRRRLTRAGADGMPPHITLLYPFTDSTLLSDGRMREVGEIIASCESFRVSLRSVGRFDSDPPILYLVPEPTTPFAALTRALVAAFPEHQPYGGKYPDPAPHLTVAIADSGTLDAIEAELRPSLPIEAHVSEAWLMQRGADESWAVRRRFELSPPPDPSD